MESGAMIQFWVAAVLLGLFFWVEIRYYLITMKFLGQVLSDREWRLWVLGLPEVGDTIQEKVGFVTAKTTNLLEAILEGSVLAGLLMGIASIAIEVRTAAGSAEAMRSIVSHACVRIALMSMPAVAVWMMLRGLHSRIFDVEKALVDERKGKRKTP